MEKSQTEIINEIRANVAFEHLIASIVSGTALGGAVILFGQVLFAFLFGALSFSVVLSVILYSLTALFIMFLIAFLAGALIITPLFKTFEKTKRRNFWPYLAALLGVCAVSLAAYSQIFGWSRSDLPLGLGAIAASIFIGVDFGRRMKPLWRAIERAENEQSSPNPYIIQKQH